MNNDIRHMSIKKLDKYLLENNFSKTELHRMYMAYCSDCTHQADCSGKQALICEDNKSLIAKYMSKQ